VYITKYIFALAIKLSVYNYLRIFFNYFESHTVQRLYKKVLNIYIANHRDYDPNQSLLTKNAPLIHSSNLRFNSLKECVCVYIKPSSIYYLVVYTHKNASPVGTLVIDNQLSEKLVEQWAHQIEWRFGPNPRQIKCNLKHGSQHKPCDNYLHSS